MALFAFIYVVLQLLDILFAIHALDSFRRMDEYEQECAKNPLTGFSKVVYYIAIALTPGAKMIVLIFKMHMLGYEKRYIQFLFEKIKEAQQDQTEAEGSYHVH